MLVGGCGGCGGASFGAGGGVTDVAAGRSKEIVFLEASFWGFLVGGLG